MSRDSRNSQVLGPTQRQLRVGEEIRHALSAILTRGEVSDPEIENIPITVSEVRVSPDLKNATAFVMPLGGFNRENILATLIKLAPQFRKLVSKMVTLRYATKIQFRLDNSYDEASRIDALLRNPHVARDLEKKKE